MAVLLVAAHAVSQVHDLPRQRLEGRPEVLSRLHDDDPVAGGIDAQVREQVDGERLLPLRAQHHIYAGDADRRHGPERVMDLAEERAPGGFARVEDVFAPGELEGISAQYKQVAGFTIPGR